MMNSYRKEYFNNHCYFLIEGNNDEYTLSYSVYNTLTESEKSKSKKIFKKDDLKKVEDKVKKIVKSNKKVTKQEIDELVDEDGTFLTSRIPILNKWLTPKKITSVTVMQSRISNDPVTRGYRVYYGENKEENDNVLNEVDMEDTFGYKETKFKDFKDTMKTFKKLGIEDPEERLERTKQLGKIRGQKVRKTKDGKKVLKQRLVEKEKLDEIKKEKMIKMVEDILTKKGEEKEVLSKENTDDGLNKILVKNLESIKKIAKKEGISLNKLINILKQGE
jgi:hypothetical protein